MRQSAAAPLASNPSCTVRLTVSGRKLSRRQRLVDDRHCLVWEVTLRVVMLPRECSALRDQSTRALTSTEIPGWTTAVLGLAARPDPSTSKNSWRCRESRRCVVRFRPPCRAVLLMRVIRQRIHFCLTQAAVKRARFNAADDAAAWGSPYTADHSEVPPAPTSGSGSTAGVLFALVHQQPLPHRFSACSVPMQAALRPFHDRLCFHFLVWPACRSEKCLHQTALEMRC